MDKGDNLMRLLQARVADELYFAAKERAAKERLTLGEFFSKAVEEYLAKSAENESVVSTLKEIGKYES